MKEKSTAKPAEKMFLFGVRQGRETKAALEEHLEELARLADTAGAVVVGRMTQELRDGVSPATLIGSGKVEELKNALKEVGADCVVFDHPLTPAQQRNLTEQLETKVLERAQLILDIFVRNAKSHESKVQVQLAQLEYLLPRLAGMWTHLERQTGGIGVRGGAGEAQIELDRRIIRDDIAKLKKKLEHIKTQRQTQRKKRTGAFRVALVGYTNAGKSTLLKRLTGADVYIADQLFATLDPSIKSFHDPGQGAILLIDTVGFIRKLPHQLVASFRATLEEVLEADLLLLVAASHSDTLDDHIAVVREVLGEIGAGDIPWKLVLNQVDRLTPEAKTEMQTLYPDAMMVSALTGLGIEELRALLAHEKQEMRKPAEAAPALEEPADAHDSGDARSGDALAEHELVGADADGVDAAESQRD